MYKPTSVLVASGRWRFMVFEAADTSSFASYLTYATRGGELCYVVRTEVTHKDVLENGPILRAKLRLLEHCIEQCMED
jgi:hypothetical protein